MLTCLKQKCLRQCSGHWTSTVKRVHLIDSVHRPYQIPVSAFARVPSQTYCTYKIRMEARATTITMCLWEVLHSRSCFELPMKAYHLSDTTDFVIPLPETLRKCVPMSPSSLTCTLSQLEHLGTRLRTLKMVPVWMYMHRVLGKGLKMHLLTNGFSILLHILMPNPQSKSITSNMRKRKKRQYKQQVLHVE